MRNIFIAISCVVLLATDALAKDRGPMILNNIFLGSASGGAIGLSAGFLAYAESNNTDEDVLWIGTVYGLLTGALFGTGVSIYEISSNHTTVGSTLSGYMLGGTGLGAFLGLIVARVPYQDNPDNSYFSRGLGWGGIIGACLGLGIALLDLNAQNSGGSYLLSENIGVPAGDQPLLLPIKNNGAAASLLTCRLMEVVF